ncbi:MAG TPA: glycosyltransferase family 2 protein [Patescibacteria group bacterium]|nr:glycosyltransferase family 2 protein [Patescibacteria group bacterium]
MKKTAVILVNYKDYAKKFLSECRQSLQEQSYKDFKVFIVDNASSEDSEKYLKQKYPEAEIIPRKDGNYAAANNAGIKKAREQGIDLYVIANMDTRFDRFWLENLVKAFEGAKNPGMVQSKILLYPEDGNFNKAKINSLGNELHYLGFGFTRGYKKSDSADRPEISRIKGYASGCSYITDRKVVDKIGLYNEEYFMYHDDLEMGWRAKLAGYEVYLADKSVVYHKYEFSRSVRMIYYMERNRYLALFTYYKLATVLLLLPIVIFLELGMIVYSLFGGWLWQKLRIKGYFLRPSTWKKIHRAKKQIKNLREKKDSQVLPDMVKEIKFQEIENIILNKIINPLMWGYYKIIKLIIRW